MGSGPSVYPGHARFLKNMDYFVEFAAYQPELILVCFYFDKNLMLFINTDEM